MSAAHDRTPLPAILLDGDWALDFLFYGADTSSAANFPGGSTFDLVLAPAGIAKPTADRLITLTSSDHISLATPNDVAIAVPKATLQAWAPGTYDVELRRTGPGSVFEPLYIGSVSLFTGLSQVPANGGGGRFGRMPGAAGDVAIFTAGDQVSIVRGESAGAVALASASAAAALADRLLADNDVILTHADAASTHNDTISTAADRTATHTDRLLADNDVILTHADVVSTHADAAATHNDTISTAADRTATHTDRLLADNDVILTHADVVSTHADAAATHNDTISTAADRVQTGADRVQTGADVATANTAAGSATASATAAAASAAGVAGMPDLPSIVNHFYPCDEGQGTSLRDVIGGAAISLSSGGGTVAWTKGGWLQFTAGWIKTASITAQAMFGIFRVTEGDISEYLMVSPTGKAVGTGYWDTGLTINVLSGFAPHTGVVRSNSTPSAGTGLDSGGWQVPLAAKVSAAETGVFAISAGSNTGAGASTIECAGFGYCSTVPSSAQMRQILNALRHYSRKRSIFLAPDDCPIKADLLVGIGESTVDGSGSSLLTQLQNYAQAAFTATVTNGLLAVTAVAKGKLAVGQLVMNGTTPVGVISGFSTGNGGTGNYYITGASNLGSTSLTGVINARALKCQNMLVNAYNGASASTTGKVMQPISFDVTGANNNAPNVSTKFGAEFGIMMGRLLGLGSGSGRLGRLLHLLKIAQGSTFLTPSGAGGATALYNAAAVNGYISGTTLTVTSITSGVPLDPMLVTGAGVTANTTITADAGGAGGVGAYTVSPSQTVGSAGAPVALTLQQQVPPSKSRNPLPGDTYPSVSLFWTLLVKQLLGQEARARNEGVGYVSLAFYYGEGLNDAYMGDGLITSAALYLGWLESVWTALLNITGLSSVPIIVIKPHLPYPFDGTLGGGDTEYPNNAIGQSRLNALNFIRTACDSFAANHAGAVSILDGNNYELNIATSDYVHPDAYGYDKQGQDVEAAHNYATALLQPAS